MAKEILVQETLTGITGDYYNELLCIAMAVQQKGIEWLATRVRERPLRKYAERYPPDMYEWEITLQNQGVIRELDNLVDGVNRVAPQQGFTGQQLLDLVNQAQNLIYGHTSFPKTIQELRSKHGTKL